MLLTKRLQFDSKTTSANFFSLEAFVASLFSFNPQTIIKMSVQQWVSPLQGIDSLRQTEAPMPSVGAGEVLVEIRAVSLNYRDVEGEYYTEARI